MQGALAKEGLDAYRVGAAANPGPMLYEVSADWRNTTTPYGPGHLWLGKGVTTITGDNVTAGIFAFKLLTLVARSEEHTSELQSRFDIVCRLLLEKKKFH